MKKYYWYSTDKSSKKKEIINKLDKDDFSIIWNIFANKIAVYYFEPTIKYKLSELACYESEEITEIVLKPDTLVEVEDVKNKEFYRIPITDVSQYIKVLDIVDKNNQAVYRGQANKDWKLEASIFRNHYNDKKEMQIYHEIKRHNYQEFQRDNFFDNIVHMQHYGIPTRLLDWSKNPMIALFFACSNSNVDGKVFIHFPDFILDFDDEMYVKLSAYLEKVYNGKDLTDDDLKYLSKIYRENKPIFVAPPYENDRIRAQKGLFSVKVDITKDYREKVRKFIWEDSVKNLEGQVSFEEIKDYDRDECLVEIRKRVLIEDYEFEKIVKSLEECHFFSMEEVSSEVNMESEFIEIVIPRDMKEKIKKQLERVGMDEIYVYPDLNGFVQYINEKYK